MAQDLQPVFVIRRHGRNGRRTGGDRGGKVEQHLRAAG